MSSTLQKELTQSNLPEQHARRAQHQIRNTKIYFLSVPNIHFCNFDARNVWEHQKLLSTKKPYLCHPKTSQTQNLSASKYICSSDKTDFCRLFADKIGLDSNFNPLVSCVISFEYNIIPRQLFLIKVYPRTLFLLIFFHFFLLSWFIFCYSVIYIFIYFIRSNVRCLAAWVNCLLLKKMVKLACLKKKIGKTCSFKEKIW